MSGGFTFRPAKRENTPLIIGIAGPTKSGKTYSAHRLSRGLVGDRPNPKIIMLNAEGARGHQYADGFSYIACDIAAPFGPDRYSEAVVEIKKQGPDALIIDSCSHMHDGPGGMLEWHEAELDRMAANDYKKRERCTYAAWIKPKAAENAFIYAMLSLDCPVILCFRAKEKLKIVPGKDPVDLGWQPIAGDRITFETIFTLVLPPHSKGVPDLSASEMREPFDTMVPAGKPIDEALGRQLAAWARGGSTSSTTALHTSGIEPEFHPKCDTCNGVLTFIPAGTLENGRAFDPFWKCEAGGHKCSLKHSQALSEAARMKADLQTTNH